ncbi:MAG: bacillithiol biosynthesis cysteine-adding enzyme BshC [Sphingobacteriaceae bacterium]|nr:bacillithiol biosynthesis cysteine-adding enzyme BshC [Sphingobacteriaceae bacterium]
MKAKYISYQETHAFSKLVLDYVNENDFLKSFYSYRPDINGLKAAIENRNFTGNRLALVEVLKNQYQKINPNELVLNNIQLLEKPNTFTVTTGHQLNLFTGPLYFIYKIVSTINLALELKLAFPDQNFVPIYWMATEDHDFEEINHVNVEDAHIRWTQKTTGATGRLDTKSITEAVNAYKGYLGISENGKKLAKIIEKAYLTHANLADATQYLVNSLFDKYGLVIVNADDSKLKKQFAAIIKKDITERHSEKNIKASSAELDKKGYKTQVNGREINFFYLKNDLRERIVFQDNRYKINHTEISFSKDEILDEINQYPERFSPNVVMRPLYQESILPNIAYIGGGAEVSYWMQLKANFDFYKVDFPVLLLRNSVLLIDKRSTENIYSLGLKFEDVFLSIDELKEKWIKQNSDAKLCLTDEKQAINAIFEKIKLQAYKADKTLDASTESAKIKTDKLLSNLEKKLLRAEKRKHETALNQIENLKNRLFPKQTLQERVFNIAPMYVNYGEDFLSSLIENLEPLGGDFTILLA